MKKLQNNKDNIVNSYLVDELINRCFYLLVLYQEKGRSTYDSFEQYIESILKEAYGTDKFEIIKKRLVKKINKK